MSEENFALEEQDPIPPMTEVSRPDIAPPEKKRRGRKPFARDAAGNIIRTSEEQAKVEASAAKRLSTLGKTPRKPVEKQTHAQMQAQVVKEEIKARLPQNMLMTDANVGKALAGAFAAIGLFRGPHWRLFSQEESELGECFGPLARLYGPEQLAIWVTVLMTVPVVTAILMPRIGVERMIMQGDIKRQEARVTLLQIRALSEAEKTMNIEQQVRESEAYLRAQVGVGMAVGVDMKQAEIKQEGVLNGAQS